MPSMAGGGRRVKRTDPTGTQSVPRGTRRRAGMGVTAPSRSPPRHCSPACRRRAFPPFPANDNDEVPVLVHFSPERQEGRTLIRLKQPEEQGQQASQ
ncbi:MAG: hypothetical protein ACLQNE_00345 [Thermoguttaceae bacterium]